jgi:hypothetical protein
MPDVGPRGITSVRWSANPTTQPSIVPLPEAIRQDAPTGDGKSQTLTVSPRTALTRPPTPSGWA